jgi:alpha-tubulin suppressor-like RCC1 family protein/GH25 family lysozyme M1 (1,4-beta-N-acetylmuramidase)
MKFPWSSIGSVILIAFCVSMGGLHLAKAARPIGIDVSDYQSSSINWSILKSNYGISFGWAKISEGQSSAGGSHFAAYAASAKAAGVPIGAYHFARYDLNTGTNGATAEANYFWGRAKNYLVGGGYYLMPMLDVEASFTGQTKASISAWVNQWCLTVSNNAAANGVPGVRPCIYISSSKAVTYLNSSVTQWPTDIANWPYAHATAAAQAQAASGPPAGITPWSTWQFWQYDDQCVAEAYTTGDGDIFNGTYAQMTNTMVINTNPVIIVTGPSITNQPTDLTVAPGSSVTFLVGASGSALLNYQWNFQGNPISGATASAYSIPIAQAANAGAYSVVVSNSAGSVLSSNALLAVLSLGGWGDDALNQINFGADPTNLVGIAAGGWHSLGLRPDGTILAWGNDYDGQCEPPSDLTDAAAIAAGGYHSLAIRAGGQMVGWGNNEYDQATPPAGLSDVLAVAAGTWHSLALRTDGRVFAWGENSWGQTNVPAGLNNVVAIAAGGNHNLALKSDGTVVAWGDNGDADGNFVGQSEVPSGLSGVVGIAAGKYHGLALKSDGTVVAWGDNSQSQCSVPSALAEVVAVAGGGGHSLALKADGTVVTWGNTINGQCAVPGSLSNSVAIGGGENYSMVLVAGSLPVPQLLRPTLKAKQFSAVVQTLNRKKYALEFKNSLAAPAWTAISTNSGNGALELLSDHAATGAQRLYRMREW